MKGIDGFIQATEEKHDPEVVAYGMLMLLDGVVTFCVLLLCGFIFQKIIPTLIYILYSYIVAGATGSYHASSHIKCWVVSFAMYLAAIFVPGSCSESLFWKASSICIPICLILVWLVAPVEHPDKPLMTKICLRNKWKSRFYIVVTACLIIIFQKNHRQIAGILLVNMMEVVILMMIGKVVNRTHEESIY